MQVSMSGVWVGRNVRDYDFMRGDERVQGSTQTGYISTTGSRPVVEFRIPDELGDEFARVKFGQKVVVELEGRAKNDKLVMWAEGLSTGDAG